MNCSRTLTTADDLADIVDRLKLSGLPVSQDGISKDHTKAWTYFYLSDHLQLNFDMSNEYQQDNEITIVRSSPNYDYKIIYRDDETQIEKDMKDQGNVELKEDQIYFNLYQAEESLSGERETRYQRRLRRQRQDSGKPRIRAPPKQRLFWGEDKPDISLDLGKYVKDQCVLDYFSSNTLIRS
jgi:hypothetical protein